MGSFIGDVVVTLLKKGGSSTDIIIIYHYTPSARPFYTGRIIISIQKS